MLRFVAVAAIALAVAAVSTQAAAPSPCSSSICSTDPVCGFQAPFRCSTGNSVQCFANASANCSGTAFCDARSCSTPKCASSCPSSVCDAAPCTSSRGWVCAAGFAKNGCSASPVSWINTTTCGQCCNLESCPTKKPQPTFTPTPSHAPFTCGKCTTAECERPYRCEESFMCVSGASAGGCSTNASFWGQSPTCSSCCDTSSCKITCTACPARACFAPVCPRSVPFTCTAGADKGGCAASQSYWDKTSGCTSCCKCPSK